VCEPLRGLAARHWSQRRTRIDWAHGSAHCRKELLDVCYPDAERVVLCKTTWCKTT